MENYKFFEHTSLARQLFILQALSEGTTTQNEIAIKAGIVPSLVNKYLKLFLQEGFVEKTKGKYNLTQKGIIKLNYLKLMYLLEISQLYQSIEIKFQDIFLKLSGKRSICIFGAGVVGKMLLGLIANKANINVISFLDEDKKKVGSKINGIPILPLEEKVQADAVIVASFKNGELMAKKALENGLRNVYVVEFVSDKLKFVWKG